MSHTLQDSISWVQASLGYKNPAVGTGNEPALTCGNMTQQVILSAPFRHNFNRSTVTFQTVAFQQDYNPGGLTNFGWMETASFQPACTVTNISANGTAATYTVSGLVSNTILGSFVVGSLVTITGLTNTAFNVTNATITAVTTTSLSIAWSSTLSSTGDSGVACSGQIKEFGKVLNRIPLAQSSDFQVPSTIAAQTNNLSGNVVFRLLGIPKQIYNVVVTYQLAPTTFTSLAAYWSLPDYMQWVYNLGFRAHLYESLGDTRAQQAKIQFAAALLSYSEGMSESEINMFLVQYLGSAAQAMAAQLGTQQGISARGQA